MFKFKFLDSGLIWGNGGALDTNFAFFDSVGSIDCDLIVGRISVLNTKVKVFDVEVKEGVDEIFLDLLPDDSGHLITIKFSNWVLNLDFFKLHQKRYFN